MTLFRLMIAGLVFFSWANVQGQTFQDLPPKNDRCMFSREMFVGEVVHNQSNEFATVGPEAETPAEHPTTCILTYENDMWFHFKTIEEFEFYEVIIAHDACNTPAGLQALIIRADGCDKSQFTYRGCSNKENKDTIKIFLEEPTAGLNHFIYVDGFDGTICSYSIELRGIRKEDLDMKEYKYVRYNYDLKTVPEFVPEQFHQEFINNELVLEWTASSEDEIAFFLVEIYPYYREGAKNGNYTKLLATIDANNKVAGGETDYRFIDFMTKFQAKSYCYRIVGVNSAGEKMYSRDIVVEAEPITTFYVAPVKRTREPGKVGVSYLNKKKKVTYTCDVLNSDEEVVKSMQLVKEPIRDGIITIDMSAYPAGQYFFRMSDGEQAFRREFFWEGT